jgi:integrase/recombinase XerD
MTSKNLAPRTRVGLLHTAVGFLYSFARPLRLATVHDVRLYLASRARDLGAVTLAAETSRLRSVLRSLVDVGLLRVSPAEDVRPPWPPRREQLLLQEASVRALLDAALVETARNGLGRPAALRDRAALEILYALGVRASELRDLRVVDLNLADGTLLVRRAKRGGERMLPLPASTVPHLRCYLGDGRPALVRSGLDEGALLVTNRGMPLRHSAVQKLVDRVAAKAGLRAHPHAFRRAVATHLARRGVSVLAVQDLLGHAGLATTQQYVASEGEDLRRAVDALDLLREKGG